MLLKSWQACIRAEHLCRCRKLFAIMQGSEQASADPSAFASSLNLDSSVQQVRIFVMLISSSSNTDSNYEDGTGNKASSKVT